MDIYKTLSNPVSTNRFLGKAGTVTASSINPSSLFCCYSTISFSSGLRPQGVVSDLASADWQRIGELELDLRVHTPCTRVMVLTWQRGFPHDKTWGTHGNYISRYYALPLLMSYALNALFGLWPLLFVSQGLEVKRVRP